MVFSCCAIGCSNRQGKPGVKFCRFPADKERREKWIAAIRRVGWTPTEYSRICTDHFITGKPSKNPFHQDYVPSVFTFNETTTSEAVSSRHLRAVQRSKCKLISTHDAANPEKRIRLDEGSSQGRSAPRANASVASWDEEVSDHDDDSSVEVDDIGDLSEDDRAGSFDSVREESEDENVDEDTVVGVDNGNEEDHEDEEELDRRDLEIEVGELQLQVAKLEETNDDLQCENNYLKDQVHELQQKLESFTRMFQKVFLKY